MHTNTARLLLAVLGGAALMSMTSSARARPWGGSDRHGAIVVSHKATRAIAAGPTFLHVYSATSGGTIYVASLAMGGDADCSGLAAGALPHATQLVADQVLVVRVETGEVACLETTADRWFELLWHAL